MMRCAALYATAMLVTTSCAPALIARGPATLPIPMPGDNSDPDEEWFATSKKLLIENIKLKSQGKLELIDCHEERDIALSRQVTAEAIAADATSGVGGFLKVWGLPIGLFIGLVGGGAIAYGVSHK